MERFTVLRANDGGYAGMGDERASSSREPRSSGPGQRSTLARSVAQHRAFLELARVVASGPQGIWTGALPVLLSPAGAAWGVVYRVAGNGIELFASEGLPLALRPHVEVFDLLRHGGFAACRAARTRRTVTEERIFAAATDARTAAGFEAAGLGSGAAVPIAHGGTVFGVLVAGGAAPEGLDADAVMFLGAAASLLAPALALADARAGGTGDRRSSSPPRAGTGRGRDGRDASGAARDAGGTARDASGATRDASGTARDAGGAAREAGGAARDASGAAREAGGAARDASGAARDAGGAARDAGGAAREAGGAARDASGAARDAGGAARDASGGAWDWDEGSAGRRGTSRPPRGGAEGGARLARGGEMEGARRADGPRGSSSPPRRAAAAPDGPGRAAPGPSSPPRGASVDAGRAVVEAVQQCMPFLRRSGIDVRVAVEEGHAAAGEASDVGLAIAHLVTNAAEATAELEPSALAPSQPRRVRVAVTREGSMILVSVDDSGRGVPPDLRARVFEPGFSTKGKKRGNGLTVVRKIALAVGGHVEVGASDLGGASFRLVLPASAEPPERSTSGLWHTGATWPQMHASGREARDGGREGQGEGGDGDPAVVTFRRASSG